MKAKILDLLFIIGCALIVASVAVGSHQIGAWIVELIFQ